jgi:hypothetical protein
MKKNLWHPVPQFPELRFGQYIVPNFVSNSVAIQVNENEFVVISPGKPLLDAWPEAWNRPDIKLHIIMPNGYHYMGVKHWQQRFRHFELYASRQAITRLVQQGVVASENEIYALEERQPPLPDGYSVLLPPGHRAGDAWIKKESKQGCLWITCDSFLNYDRLSNQPVARFTQKLLDAAPGLKMSQVVKWFIIEDRAKFKTWVLNQLQLDKPTTMIPSHGEIAQSETLYKELNQLVQERL